MSSNLGVSLNAMPDQSRLYGPLGTLIIQDLNRVGAIDINLEGATFEPLPINAVVVTSVSLEGCLMIQIDRHAAPNDHSAPCDFLQYAADQLSVYISKREITVNELGALGILDRKGDRSTQRTSTTEIPESTVAAPNDDLEFVSSAAESTMATGTLTLTIVLIVLAIASVYFWYTRSNHYQAHCGAVAGKETIELSGIGNGQTQTASTKDEGPPIVMNHLFETSFDRADTQATVDIDFAVHSIALSHHRSKFSLAAAAAEESGIIQDRRSIADWGFEADIDVDASFGVMHLSGMEDENELDLDAVVNDALPNELPAYQSSCGEMMPTSPPGSAVKLQYTMAEAANVGGAGAAGAGAGAGAGADVGQELGVPLMLVSIPSPLGMSFGDNGNGAFVVTKLKEGGNAMTGGKVRVGFEITTVNGTAVSGLTKADVATLIKASAGDCAVEFRQGAAPPADQPMIISTGKPSGGNQAARGAPLVKEKSVGSLQVLMPTGKEKKGATGDANHGDFRHSVLDEVLQGDDPVLHVQMGEGGVRPTNPAPTKAGHHKKEKEKKEKKKSKSAKASNWNACGLPKEEALARLHQAPPGSFVFRDTDKGYAALSMVKLDGKIYNRIVTQTPGGLSLIKAPTTFPTLEALVKNYVGKVALDGLPLPFRV
jgi:hypothetical protein